jgi:Kef-type K+ transport system membrane component KefB
MITPFFFINGGVSVSLADVAQNWLLLVILFGVKSAWHFGPRRHRRQHANGTR